VPCKNWIVGYASSGGRAFALPWHLGI